jgi:hypothetical protein
MLRSTATAAADEDEDEDEDEGEGEGEGEGGDGDGDGDGDGEAEEGGEHKLVKVVERYHEYCKNLEVSIMLMSQLSSHVTYFDSFSLEI